MVESYFYPYYNSKTVILELLAMSKNGFMSERRGLVATLGAVLLLSGCASSQPMRGNDAEPDLNSMKYLEEVAGEARLELRILAQMKQATAMKTMTDADHKQFAINALEVPPGFEKRVDLDIVDHAEVVAEAVAAYAGYRFDVIGDNDGHEIPVTIQLSNDPLNDALKELGAQTGDMAEIHIVPNKMIFEYKSRRHSSNMPSQWGN